MNEWEEKKDVSVDALKALIQELRQAHSHYETLKETANEAREKYEALSLKVIGTLQAAGLKNFDIPGLGKVTLASKYSVRVPKNLEDKRKLFDYIRNAYGDDVLDEYRTINYQTLNAFVNQEAEISKVEKQAMRIPGIESPTEEFYLQFRKDRG